MNKKLLGKNLVAGVVLGLFVLSVLLVGVAAPLSVLADKPPTPTPTTGGDVESYGPGCVVGEFKYDPEYAKFVAEKERLAEEYASAKERGDVQKAKIVLEKFKEKYTSVKKSPDTARPETDVRKSDGLYQTTSSSARIGGIIQYPQETNYYCGPAAAKSVLHNEGIDWSQTKLAGDGYTQADRFDGAPWYITDSYLWSEFPMATTLTYATSFYYIPSPYGPAGTNPQSADQIRSRIMSTIDLGHGVVAAGTSCIDTYQLPGYPAGEVHHWVAIDGYLNSGGDIWIVDPVANSPAVSFGDDVVPYYNIPINGLTTFVEPAGIVW